MQDVVIYTSGCLDSEKRGSDFHCELAEFVKSTEQRLLALSPSTYINGETILEALAKTLLCSRDYKEVLIEPEIKLESEYQKYLQSFLAGVVNHELPYARDFRLSSALDETQLCITARGYMCLVPKEIQNGDYIGVACGLQMPLAFRRVGQDAKGQLQYELYSEVYVHGMMCSQTWNLMEDYRPKLSAEEYAFLNSEPPSKVIQSPGTYKKRENFVSALDIGYEYVTPPLDGYEDVVLIEPEDCKYNPEHLVGNQIECDGEAAVKFTSQMIDVVRQIREGPKSPLGAKFWHGLAPGASYLSTANISISPNGAFHEWQWSMEAETVESAALRNSGVKMITWHGLADAIVPYKNRSYIESGWSTGWEVLEKMTSFTECSQRLALLIALGALAQSPLILW
ncbi:unnamed protein product [Alternaria alternata]